MVATLAVAASLACTGRVTVGGNRGRGDASAADASGGDAGASDAGDVDAGGGDAGALDGAARPDGGAPLDGGPFTPNPALAGLGDESVLDLGQLACTPVAGEDPDLCRRTTDYSGFVYDPHHHQMLLYGGGHSTTMTDAIHALDLGGSLRWTDLYEPTPCSSMTAANLDAQNGAWLGGNGGPFPRPVSTHTYDMLAVAPRLDEFIVISRNFTGGYCNPVGNDIGGAIAHFDRAAQTWSFSPTARGSSYELGVNIPGSEPDPVSGQIVLFSGAGLSLYDPATRVYTHVADTLLGSSGQPTNVTGTGYANHLVYFPPDDRFYYFARNSPVDVYALKLDRADPSRSVVDLLATTGPTSPHGEPAYDYDSRNAIIGGAVAGSTFYAFDPATRSWSSHPMNGGSPGDEAFHALAYDPVDNVFLFVTDYNSGAHTWAYRLRR